MRFAVVAVALQAASSVSAVLIDGLCSTKLGVLSVKNVPTSTTTLGLPLTAYMAKCAYTTKTTTPKPITTTLTETSTSSTTTTAGQLTGTVTTTSTATQTNTLSLSTTVTTTTTTTSTITNTPTSTIPAAAGFTPIASDLSYVAKKRDIPERFSLNKRATSQFVKSNKLGSNKKATYSPAAYPQSVKCIKYQREVVTKTITIPFCTKTKTTTLAIATSTIRETVSTTTTITEIPPAATITESASTTVTIETSTTLTQTNTETATETQTSTGPSATVYAACASNNIIGAANGNNGIYAIAYGQNSLSSASATTAYDCCVACQQTANCAYSNFYFGYCELIIGTTCAPGGGSPGTFYTSNGFAANEGFTFSNGPCGRVVNGGSG